MSTRRRPLLLRAAVISLVFAALVAPVAARGKKGAGKKGGRNAAGLIKPAMSDTMKINVYADNWFILYINGRLVDVDSIQFTPHNVISVDPLPEYPMTIAVMAKDNADPQTALEYGDHIGDGAVRSAGEVNEVARVRPAKINDF